MNYLIGVDVGTTATKAVLYDEHANTPPFEQPELVFRDSGDKECFSSESVCAPANLVTCLILSAVPDALRSATTIPHGQDRRGAVCDFDVRLAEVRLVQVRPPTLGDAVVHRDCRARAPVYGGEDNLGRWRYATSLVALN